MTTEERLRRLERGVRWTRVILTSVLLGLIVFVAACSNSPRASDSSSEASTTAASIRKHIENEEFAKATDVIETAANRWRGPEATAQLEELRKLTDDAMAAAWQRRHDQAQHHAESGNFRVTKAIYEIIVERWGCPEYTKLAEAELAKLNGAEHE